MLRASIKNDDIVRRIDQMSMPEPNSGCWIWLGHLSGCKMQYGKISVNRRSIGAHRASYAAHNGEIPDGHCVRHICDNPACVNPDHLVLGTNQDNVDDRNRRGRQCQGTRHPQSRLTTEQVHYIRGSKRSNYDLGREFGVMDTTIRSVKLRLTYRDIPELSEAEGK